MMVGRWFASVEVVFKWGVSEGFCILPSGPLFSGVGVSRFPKNKMAFSKCIT